MSIALNAVGPIAPNAPALRWPRRLQALLRLRRYPGQRRRRARLVTRWMDDYVRQQRCG